MDAGAAPAAAFLVADDPARGVARRDGAFAGQLLARFQRDVGDLAGAE